jgi:hypothetical protein
MRKATNAAQLIDRLIQAVEDDKPARPAAWHS